jgi:RNA polymerase sigma-54 factor
MTPSLQQAIKLLQLSRLELEETLSQEILENPVLDVEDPTDDTPQAEAEVVEDSAAASTETPASEEERAGAAATDESPAAEPQESYDEIDVEAFFSDYIGDSRSEGPSLVYSGDSEGSLENVVSAAAGLYDHLVWQLHLSSCPERLLDVCEFIIGNLDQDGFLRATDEEIIRATGVALEDVQQATEIVRSLDPPGIASRTLQECLAAQIVHLIASASDREEIALLERVRVVVSEHWDDLLHQRWERLAAALQCELSDLRPLLDVIHRLEPKPGRQYHREDNAYIEPDVYVRDVDGEYTITLNDDGLPRLRINSRYARMLEGGLDPQVANYLREKMRSAVWLMKSIDQRQRTIYKVAKSIVAFQRAFLDHGIEHLRPMVLRQVAEDIGMHESTISRVVSNKYMYTPRGLFPMKFFFHSGVDSARGENVSSLVVKERIRKLVEAEEPSRPLSDSKIMKTLQREGMRLARRTVAKYREELGIPSSDKRKRVF